MKISDVIKELETIKRLYGDIEALILTPEDEVYHTIDYVEVFDSEDSDNITSAIIGFNGEEEND